MLKPSTITKQNKSVIYKKQGTKILMNYWHYHNDLYKPIYVFYYCSLKQLVLKFDLFTYLSTTNKRIHQIIVFRNEQGISLRRYQSQLVDHSQAYNLQWHHYTLKFLFCGYLFLQLMLIRLIHSTLARLALTKFSDEVVQKILPSAPHLSKPQVIDTQARQQYRESHKIKFKRMPQKDLRDNWTRSHYNRLYTEREAITQASRCMKCADSPCQKACSVGIDIRSFIYQIRNQNYYGAAKTILSDNPLGLSCGGLCPVSELCASTCNAYWLDGGTIEIGKLQEFACKVFKEMRVRQVRDPNLKPLDPRVAATKIALIGAGSASLSCAAFLGRLGYNNVHIYEKYNYGGGLVTREIPANRSNFEDVEWELGMVEQLGVRIFYGKQFGKDITEASLKADGYEVIFVGSGLNSAKDELGKEAYLLPNVFSSKTFLPNVCENVKLSKSKEKIFQLKGHVVVLGIGDTALDCARSALRVGADRVTVVFRRGFNDMRANGQIFDPSVYERINFISNMTPHKVLKENGVAVGMEFEQYFFDGKEYKLTGEKVRINSDFIISAFGSKNTQTAVEALVKDEKGKVNINRHTMQNKSKPHIYAGGDIIGTNNLVDAVNDGKVASWFIHKSIGAKHDIDYGITPNLPGFFTEIDLVDISTNMAGVHFANPFGLASAAPSTSYPMIRRAFELGWGFAVIKTFVLQKGEIVNVAPRIFKATNDILRREPSFSNIEMISEKRARYWVQGAKQLKKDFPNKVLIGSIMASHIQQDWEQLAQLASEANFDILELSLRCYHGLPNIGIGTPGSQVPHVVEEIVRWVRKYFSRPVFVKLSPSSTSNEQKTQAVLNAGGAGVSATNSMCSFMDPDQLMEPYPAIGPQHNISFGGACGSILRPIALRVVTNIANQPHLKNAEIMGIGGIINAQHALAYAKYGRCSVFQIASAIQDQDFSIIQDLNTGLKAALYLTKRDDLKQKGWKGQSPPTEKSQTLKKYINNFSFWKEGEKETKVDIKTVPTLKDVRGTGSHYFKDINLMSKEQKFPVINEDLCVNCGKCYMTCLDSGYQAISFSTSTHKPEINADCTGCGLCFAVCPVPGALEYGVRPTQYPYVPQRGDEHF